MNPADIQDKVLAKEVIEWLGTPFSPNASTKGLGVSCHNFVAALYAVRGINANVPSGPPNAWRFSTESMIEDYMSKRTDFERLPPIATNIQPWDLLGFRLGHIIHHIGVCIRAGFFVHAISGQGVMIASIYDATWMKRFKALWRLK